MKTLPFYSTVIVNHNLWDLVCTTIECLALVQLRKRTGTLHVPESVIDGKVLRTRQGIYTIDAGTAPKDVINLTGTTTRLGIAWFTDWPGNKHIRIMTDRISVSSFFVPEIFWSKEDPSWTVYPDDDVHRCIECGRKCLLYKSHYQERCGWPWFVCFSCYESELYLRDMGFLPGVRLVAVR